MDYTLKYQTVTRVTDWTWFNTRILTDIAQKSPWKVGVSAS